MLSSILKSIRDFRWGTPASATDTQADISVRARESVIRSLRPTESYELCIAVHKAVSAIASNLSKASRRLFTRDGREVVGGPAYEFIHRPSQYMSGTAFIKLLLEWYNITGEMAAWLRPGAERPTAWVLCPSHLAYRDNRLYRDRSEVKFWRYTWRDGAVEDIPDDQLLFAAMFNPRDPVRGLSPLVTGAVEVGTLHWSGRYNQSFFQNSAIPSHIVELGEGVSRRERDDFTRRYLEEFNAYGHNAHKVMVVSGAELKIHTLNTSERDGEFLELRNHLIQQVAMLYGVPPIEMGIIDKSRFDTAPEERKLFMESTLMPQADMLTSVIQHQVIDRMATTGLQTRSVKMSKALRSQFEVNVERSQGPLTFILDVDTLPIANAVKANVAERAIRWRQAFGASLRETADFFGVELEPRAEREDVYLLATERNITHPEKNIEVISALAADAAESAETPDGPEDAGRDEIEASRRKVKRSLRKLRRMSIDACRTRTCWRLSDAPQETPRLNAKVRLAVKGLIERGDLDAVRQYFEDMEP